MHPDHKVKGLIGVVGAMAATASLAAAFAVRRRRLAQDSQNHPLKGSVQRRINLFAVLTARRRGAAASATDDYKEAPEDVV